MTEQLCLDGRERPLRVALYGQALDVEREGARMALAPLPRLRRISCWGRVDWAGDALLACAAHAVPISFLRGGRGAAHFLPALPPPKPFAGLIDEAWLHPEWDRRLENWMDSELRRALLAALRARPDLLAPVSRLIAAGEPRAALRAGLKVLGAAAPTRRIWSYLQEALHSWTLAKLAGESLFLGNYGFSSSRPNLVRRLALCVSPILLPVTFDQAGREARRAAPGGPADEAGAGGLNHRCQLAFAHAEPAVTRRFALALRRFERLVRDTAEEIEP